MSDSDAIELSVVVAAYNEADGISEFLQSLVNSLQSSFTKWEICLVDDGSHDDTIVKVKNMKIQQIKVIRLLTNVGQQKALIAGLQRSKGKFAVTMDADGQHPSSLILEMMNLAKNQNLAVVLGIRSYGETR